MINTPLFLFQAKAVSSTNTYYSQVINKDKVDELSIQLIFGAVTGTFTVQVSNVNRPDESDDDDWTTLDIDIINPSGAADSHVIDPLISKSKYLRLKYVNASGSSTITAILKA